MFIFFTATVVYALIEKTEDWSALVERFGAWMTVHSVLMLLAGVMLGIAVVCAAVLPRWTGIALISGMVLIGIASVLPDVAQTAAAGVRDVAFAGMGAALLRNSNAAGV